MAAARWLARLHGSRLELDRRLDVDHEVANAEEWAATIAQAMPSLGSGGRGRGRRRCSRPRPACGSGPTCRSTRTSTISTWCSRPDCLSVVDLDEARLGDAALDVAHFVVYLQLRAIRSGAPADGSPAGPDLRRRVPRRDRLGRRRALRLLRPVHGREDRQATGRGQRAAAPPRRRQKPSARPGSCWSVSGSAVMTGRVAYVVRSWPRLSQTFVLNEVLALERLGCELSIFAMVRSGEELVQPQLAQVRAPVHYLDDDPGPAGAVTAAAGLARSRPGVGHRPRPPQPRRRLRHRLTVDQPPARHAAGRRHRPVGGRRPPDRPHPRPLRPRPGAGGDVRPPAHRPALQLHRPRPRPLRGAPLGARGPRPARPRPSSPAARPTSTTCTRSCRLGSGAGSGSSTTASTCRPSRRSRPRSRRRRPRR